MTRILNLIGFQLIFLSLPAFSFVAENSLEGLGLESLMGGIGQARIGSSGALGSNPASLAWLPEKHQFMSTNQISFYKLKTESGQKLNISPDVIPRFAATSEGFNNWGHSYGLIISKFKVGLDQESTDQKTTGSQETQAINLNYALGIKSSADTAWGLGIYVGRVQEDGDYSVIGETSGYEYAFTIRDRKKFWTQGLSLGVATKTDNWAFGLSSKFTTAKFWAYGSQEQSGYTEGPNTNTSNKEHKTPKIKVVPTMSGGAKLSLDGIDLFFDLYWTPAYTASDDEKSDSRLNAGLGLEKNLGEIYKMYAGLLHSPASDGDKESGSLSFGLSKTGKNSVNYAGLSWFRAYQSAESELIKINFGTLFDY